MIPLFMSTPTHEDWLTIRPDAKRWEQLREEMAERDLTGYTPPRPDKEDADVHPWFRYALKVGWPAALSTAIIGWGLYYTPTILDLLRQMIAAMTLMQQEHMTIRERLDRAERSQGIMIDILRAGCWNDATTQTDRDRCRDAGASR